MGEQVIWEIVEIDKIRNANKNTNTDTNTIERNMIQVEKILREILQLAKSSLAIHGGAIFTAVCG